MKEPSSPRSYRLSSEALKSLKIIKGTHPDKSDAEIVSMALVCMADSSAGPPVIFRVLDVREILTLQAEAAMIERQHLTMKRDILRIRPRDKSIADKIAAVVEKADLERNHLKSLRQSLSLQGRLAAQLTPQAAKRLNILQTLAQARVEKADINVKPLWELELFILNSLYPPCTNSSDAQASKPPVAPASQSVSDTSPTPTTKTTSAKSSASPETTTVNPKARVTSSTPSSEPSKTTGTGVEENKASDQPGFLKK